MKMRAQESQIEPLFNLFTNGENENQPENNQIDNPNATIQLQINKLSVSCLRYFKQKYKVTESDGKIEIWW